MKYICTHGYKIEEKKKLNFSRLLYPNVQPEQIEFLDNSNFILQFL